MKKVKDWRIILSGDVYNPPEIRRFHLQGVLMDLPEGEPCYMTSSPIVSYDGNTVTTRSGSVYHLVGEPLMDRAGVPDKVQIYPSMSKAVEKNPYIPLS